MAAIRKGPRAVRYILIALHTVLTLGMLISYCLISRDIINLILFAVSTLAWLIYIPATIALTANDVRGSTFAAAGGEVAYLVIQWLIYLTSAITFTFGTYDNRCRYGDWASDITATRYYLGRPAYCTAYRAYQATGFVHFALLLMWFLWIVIAAHSGPANFGANRAYKLPVYRIITGRFGVDDEEFVPVNQEGKNNTLAPPTTLQRQGSAVTDVTTSSMQKEARSEV